MGSLAPSWRPDRLFGHCFCECMSFLVAREVSGMSWPDDIARSTARTSGDEQWPRVCWKGLGPPGFGCYVFDKIDAARELLVRYWQPAVMPR